ncbi:unnamed protein product [Mycena citricolor]|uniref:Uncharacterized protein n=1 Tax=Mycena citricolor TaxID=2018698 RepID=A0AAD2H8S7_9AGAR|nr:unnamed protein product [Mycena citricolor]
MVTSTRGGSESVDVLGNHVSQQRKVSAVRIRVRPSFVRSGAWALCRRAVQAALPCANSQT